VRRSNCQRNWFTEFLGEGRRRGKLNANSRSSPSNFREGRVRCATRRIKPEKQNRKFDPNSRLSLIPSRQAKVAHAPNHASIQTIYLFMLTYSFYSSNITPASHWIGGKADSYADYAVRKFASEFANVWGRRVPRRTLSSAERNLPNLPQSPASKRNNERRKTTVSLRRHSVSRFEGLRTKPSNFQTLKPLNRYEAI
jgi:hypothetical protein